ncbi:hypothetical protein J7E91_08360 [Streptomyces sp. ISL-99]|uniref:hypothetical protein n=1 Tax=Streptomyces sp. ISL-99 TaxID=2819193 RepID=UPI001BE6427D|nr:hypothetical protein [Streptomyces sp. ISL-99]MBT2525445.1 hypothetical protein [Streptomyces sp. ISL-99]
MAASQLNAAPSPPAHPLANPGYGKRSAPEQLPRRESDFAHLPRREASIAAYIDRLPDGSDISVKMLAKVLPDYGQCAVRTSLRRLSEAGHLRLGRETVTDEATGSRRWVTRTFFSRTARDDAWWAAFQGQGQGSSGTTTATPARQPSRPQPQQRSRAYEILASVGRTKPQMSLSADDCVTLESLATDWLTRGATDAELRHALTAGLPAEVHRPAAIARTRLAKLPPERASHPADLGAQGPAPTLRVLECTECRAPARPEALSGGLCRVCRAEPPLPPRDGLPEADVRAHAAKIRAAAATRRPEGTRA